MYDFHFIMAVKGQLPFSQGMNFHSLIILLLFLPGIDFCTAYKSVTTSPKTYKAGAVFMSFSFVICIYMFSNSPTEHKFF